MKSEGEVIVKTVDSEVVDREVGDWEVGIVTHLVGRGRHRLHHLAAHLGAGADGPTHARAPAGVALLPHRALRHPRARLRLAHLPTVRVCMRLA